MADHHRGWIEEYNALRAEIGDTSRVVSNVFLAGISATAALLGYGLSMKSGTLCLLPFAVLIPALFFLTSQLEDIVTMATYILVFLENDPTGLRWETRWLTIRKSGALPYSRRYTMSVSYLYGFLDTACFGLALAYWDGPITLLWVIGLPLLLIAIFGTVLLNRAFSVRFAEKHIKAWEQLKQSEKNGAADR